MILAESKADPWQCTFDADGIEVQADTTPEHGGGNAGIRPHELLEAALATCLNMTVRMAADERGVDHDGVRTAVDLDRSGDASTFRYTVDVDGVDERTAESLRRAARGCSVHETLSTDLAFAPVESLPE